MAATTSLPLALLFAAGCAAQSSKVGRTPAPPKVQPSARRAAEAAPPTETAPPARPLYERLGGRAAITAVVDAFVQRVGADPRIQFRFLNTDIPQLKAMLVDFVCVAIGGSCTYEGRDMRAAHAGMNLVEEEWTALVDDLQGALVALGVGAGEQRELLGFLGSVHDQVVNPPPADAARHDAALARRATERAALLRQAGNLTVADLLDAATVARARGQRSYAEQLFSLAELRLDDPLLAALAPLFRDGAPERITAKPKGVAPEAAPQPEASIGHSDEDSPPTDPARASLSGVLRVDGAPLEGGRGVVTLTPLQGRVAKRPPRHRVIEQRGRRFAPRIMAVPVGSTVSFPNFDPVFHNVFSRSETRPFDLGLYKRGESREVTFAREGILRIGCNLHANMAAHIIVVAAPHYAPTDGSGGFHFRRLAPGRYRLRAWSDRGREQVTQVVALKPGANQLTVEVPVAATADLDTDKFGAPRGKRP